jgi:L-cysteate sulfo-lyase
MTESKRWSRVELASWPTPLERAPRLAVALGLGEDDLWIKRDDLTGLGGGGNKVRKLEWLAGTALAQGATTLVTSGAPQSNHARLTAAVGARLGLKVVLVLTGEPSASESGNLALDGILGASVVHVGDLTRGQIDQAVEDIAESVRRSGSFPAVIPFGGSSVLGAQGYVDGGLELLEQVPDLDTVLVAVGSGGTMSGLVHVLGADRVLGVDCGAVSDPVATVTELVNGLSAHGGVPKLRLRLDQVGNGYSKLSAEVEDAIVLAARTEGSPGSLLHGARSCRSGSSDTRQRHQARPPYRATPHRRNAWSLRTPASHDLGSEAAGGATLVWSLRVQRSAST